MTHTKGHWAYRPQEYDDWGIVRMAGVDEDGFQRVICQANYVADPTELCEHRANGTDPAEANARLIAAAPNMFEALQVYADTLCEFGTSNTGCGKYADDVCFGCRARAAIAKATQ